MFTGEQKAALAAPLNGQHVKHRKQAGRSLAYIEGWKAIEEALIQQGTRNLVVAPLTYQGTVIGAVELRSPHPGSAS